MELLRLLWVDRPRVYGEYEDLLVEVARERLDEEDGSELRARVECDWGVGRAGLWGEFRVGDEVHVWRRDGVES